MDGRSSDSGIPAVIVTRYLAKYGAIVKKTGLCSFPIMFTIGITEGRRNLLVMEPQQFKDDYSNNQPLQCVLPESIRRYPQYERISLRKLCDSIHNAYQANDVVRVTIEIYLSDMESATIPSDAWAKMAHREAERITINNLEGRITGVLLIPCPPDIPLLVPGECFDKTIVQYLQFARGLNKLFLGFEMGIRGLIEKEVGGRMEYSVNCVR